MDAIRDFLYVLHIISIRFKCDQIGWARVIDVILAWYFLPLGHVNPQQLEHLLAETKNDFTLEVIGLRKFKSW